MHMKNLQLLWRSISTIGLFGTLRFGLARLLRIDTPIVVEVRGQTDRIKVLLRPRESDLFVIDQVFGNKEYDIGARRANALNALAQQWRSAGVQPVIIDGGANVGYASFYFADLYRDAIVLAVEPNPATFEVLKKSVQGHSRIVPIHAALWSHDRGVDLVHGDSGSWSDRVSDGAASPSLVPSLRLDQILAHVPSAAALIVKLDIEGSEREVCEASMPLLREAPCIVIEPHDWMLPGAGSLVPLFKALSDRQMDSLLIGENLAVLDCAMIARATRPA